MNNSKILGIGLNGDWIDGSDEALRRCIGYVHEAGAGACELILHSLDVIANNKIIPQRLVQIKEVLTEFPLIYTIHMPYAFSFYNGNVLDNVGFFKECITFAKEINAPVMTVHASKIDPKDSAAVMADRDIFRELSDFCGDDVKIGIENACYLKALAQLDDKPETLINHVRSIDRKNIGITLDFGHAYLGSIANGYDYPSALRDMMPLAVHTHIHDNFGKPVAFSRYMDALGYGFGDLHLPPYWGNMPFDMIFDLLEQYSGILMFETEFRFFSHFKTMIDRIKALGFRS